MDKPKITPKDFFLWFAAMAFLYASIFAFVALIFSYLDHAYPDKLSYYSSDPYSSGISYYMATLIVLFPIFIVLMRVIHKTIESDNTRREIWIRRWALYLTLFIAGITVAGDLITLIMYFFNGDVTLRFALKVLVILLVAGAGFLHFLADLRDYWQKNPGKARLLGYAATLLVVLTIATGFFVVGTPWQARLYRFDEQKANDLQNIQYQVINYWQAKRLLPSTLTDMNDPLIGFMAPSDPQTGEAYEYRVTGALSFELCASFNAVTQNMMGNVARPYETMPYPVKGGMGGVAETWQHETGRSCFARGPIDPDFYPPLLTR